jgi:hypothetical protein
MAFVLTGKQMPFLNFIISNIDHDGNQIQSLTFLKDDVFEYKFKKELY